MRIAVVTESFLPTVNGVSHSVERVLEHLRLRGHPALVVAPEAGPDDHEGTPVVRVPAVSVPGVSSLPVGVPTRRLHRVLARFAPDVVHVASPFVLGAGGLLAARRLGVPAVAVYQTDMAGFAHRYGAGLTAGAAWRWTCRLHRSAERTLAPSAATVAALRDAGVERVFRWGRGVDSLRFSPERRDPVLRARLAPAGELVVGYVGRLAPEKQVDRLVALAGLPGVRIAVIGDGPERARLQRLLPGASFLGALTGSALAAAFASLDVFVHTGTHETFGQTVQEAMACGLPVVAPAAGGPLELVTPGGTGFLLPPGDGFGVGLRSAVAALRDDEALRRRLGAAGRAEVRDRSWAAVCDELLDHYAAARTARPGRRTTRAA